ncbi:MAG: MFS transporter [Chloroflexi bacterium]|nr:MFS transporter [Chloroflexota bacterium]
MALLNKNSPYPAILAACFGVFIAADDQTVIVTILPSIMSDFRLGIDDLGQVSWTVTGYLLGYTAVLPLMGRISDVHGHRRVYLLAMGIFLVGSVLAAMADGLWTLVGFRVIQAVGGGAVVPVTIAMIGDLLPPGRRGMALGIMGASAEMGGVIGPLWGSLIDRFLDWRWVFWMNVPLVIIVVVLIMLLAPSGRRYPRPVDYRGGLILALVMVLVTLALSRLGEAPVQAGAGLALGGLLLAGFLWSQSRASFPLTPLSLFRRVSFSAANASHFFVGAALIIAMVNIPLITDTVMGKEPLEGGLRLLRLTGAIPVGALAGGFAASRLGYRLPTAAGLLLGATSFYFLSTWDLDLSDPMMTVHLLIGGLGFGLVIAPIATAAINSVPPEDRGTAAALLTVMRMMGMIVGLAALTSWGTDRFDTLVRGIDLSLVDPGYINEVTSAGLTVFEGFFLTAMALCLLALVPTWLMRGEKHGVQSSTVPIGGTGDTSWGR